MAQSGAPPPEAVRGGVSKTLFVVTVVIVAIIAFLGGLGLGGVFFAPPPPSKIIIGTNTPFPPFEYRDANDTVVGFDIDLVTKVLDDNGLAYELYDFRDFSALLSAVQVRRVDIAASAITSNGGIGQNRSKVMSFTNSYYEADQGILARTADTRTFCTNTTDCQASELQNLKIAVQSGTSSEFWVEDNLAGRTCGSANFTCVADVTSALTALAAASVDIVVIDLPIAQRTAAANPSTYRTAGTIQTNELYAFAVAHNDPLGLLPRMNASLAKFKTNGVYNALIAKWFSG